jgi:hypothetical protein
MSFLIIYLHPVPSLSADPASIIGSWEGVTLINPAEYEVGIEINFSREENGTLGGKLSFTTNSDFNRPVHSIHIEDSRVVFAVTDDDGVVSSFEGWLSEDGASIEGDLEERGAHYLFKLRRVDPHEIASPQPVLRRLSRNGAELKELFSQAPSRVQLLLILSASCPLCKSGLGMVQRYVLDEIKDPGLRVYVVWEPVSAEDTERSATAASRLMSDPRVVQFWGDHRFVGQAFAEALGVAAVPVWDVYLVIPGDARWETVAPSPSFVMSNMPGEQPLQKYPRFNGPELAAKIKSILANGTARLREKK